MLWVTEVAWPKTAGPPINLEAPLVDGLQFRQPVDILNELANERLVSFSRPIRSGAAGASNNQRSQSNEANGHRNLLALLRTDQSHTVIVV